MQINTLINQHKKKFDKFYINMFIVLNKLQTKTNIKKQLCK